MLAQIVALECQPLQKNQLEGQIVPLPALNPRNQDAHDTEEALWGQSAQNCFIPSYV